MAGRYKPRSSPEMNIASFSDIAFLLIIFFILTTSFVRTQGTRMEIPSRKASEQVAKATPTILLTTTEILWDKDALTLEKLRARLAAEKFPEKAADERIVILESQENVTYQRYYSVVLALTNAGAVMALQTDEKSEGGGSGGGGAAAPAAKAEPAAKAAPADKAAPAGSQPVEAK